VQLPLRGSAQVTNGNCKVDSRSRTATVLNPTQETRMIWHKGCEKILVQIDRRALHDLAESLTGHHLNQSLVFDPEIDMNRPAMQKWCRSVQSALELAEAGQGFGGVQHAQQARIEETLVLGFLNNQRSSISHLLGSKHPAPSSQQLRKAQSYMLANLAEPITLQQVARQSRCSLRSLQCGFKDHFGCTPKQYLQHQRLGYAHHLLQAANPDQLVSSLAYDAGFTHLGRFSIAYRMAYGESPSDTLAKTKRTH